MPLSLQQKATHTAPQSPSIGAATICNSKYNRQGAAACVLALTPDHLLAGTGQRYGCLVGLALCDATLASLDDLHCASLANVLWAPLRANDLHNLGRLLADAMLMSGRCNEKGTSPLIHSSNCCRWRSIELLWPYIRQLRRSLKQHLDLSSLHTSNDHLVQQLVIWHGGPLDCSAPSCCGRLSAGSSTGWFAAAAALAADAAGLPESD